MSDTVITERQQFWLDHFRAAEDFDGSLAAYARSAGLKTKELYVSGWYLQWYVQHGGGLDQRYYIYDWPNVCPGAGRSG